MPAPVPIDSLEEIDSTNAEARRRAEAGDVGPVWITALRQTAGRGRRGRAWETGQGNLAATRLSPAGKPAAEAAQISFVAALAAYDLAASCVPQALVSLKWPNDLLIGGRKAAGMLVESGVGTDGALWLAVGMGINLATPPQEAAYPATAFADHMRAPPPTPLEALSRLDAAFGVWEDLWRRLGFPPIADAWTRRAHGLGQACVARLATEEVRGIAEGLDEDGALRLRLADGGLRRITAGDVYF